MIAYVQVSLDSAREIEIYDKLKSLRNVREVNVLFGEWDMMVKVEAHSAEELAAFVMENVRSLPGVKLTSTMIVAR